MFNEAVRLLHAYGRIVRFVLAGGTGAVVNLVALYILVHYAGLYPVYGSIGSFICAFFVSFTLQKYWTYRSRVHSNAQMGLYFGIQLINLCINAALMYLFIEYTPLHYLLAQVVTNGLIAIESFFVYKHVVFIDKPAPPAV